MYLYIYPSSYQGKEVGHTEISTYDFKIYMCVHSVSGFLKKNSDCHIYSIIHELIMSSFPVLYSCH